MFFKCFLNVFLNVFIIFLNIFKCFFVTFSPNFVTICNFCNFFTDVKFEFIFCLKYS